jgi:proline iminopeptidase
VRALAVLLVSVVLASIASAASPIRAFIRSAGPVDAPRTVIVVNGGPGYDSQQMFRGFKRLASSTRRVVAYDQRGVGRSPRPRSVPGDYSLDAFVADLEALRLRLGVERVDLVGESFGALVVAAYTASHPDRVRTLSLLSALPMSVEAQFEGDARFERRLRVLQQQGLVAKTVPPLCAARTRALLPVYLGNPRSAGSVAAALGPFRCDDLVSILANDAILADPRRPRLALALGRYRGPALVLIGARDPFGSAWADDNAAPLRNARVTKRVLPGAGHLLWLESPVLFPTLRGFLARN